MFCGGFDRRTDRYNDTVCRPIDPLNWTILDDTPYHCNGRNGGRDHREMTALHRVNTTVYDTWGGHVITVVIRRGPSQRGDSAYASLM